MYDLPTIATADTHEAVQHFNVYHQAASVASRFHSILALPEHGIDRGELGEKELKVWKEVGKEASELGKELSAEIRMQVAVEETEDELEKKREELIENTWNEEMKEEGVFGDGEQDLERRKMKNLVGKETSRLAVEKMQGENEEEVDRKLLEIERQVEERRKKMIEQAMANEGEIEEEEVGEVGEGDEASRSFREFLVAVSSRSRKLLLSSTNFALRRHCYIFLFRLSYSFLASLGSTFPSYLRYFCFRTSFSYRIRIFSFFITFDCS